MMRASMIVAMLATSMAATSVAQAQSQRDLRRAVDAAIASDIAASRQAEREAKQYPYADDRQGGIVSTAQARDACGARAAGQLGATAKVIGQSYARPMSTGWEVEGVVGDTQGDVRFVCSVRNGSVTGVLLNP